MSYAPESQDPDDLRVASYHITGKGPWRDPARQVPYGHVLYTAGKLGWSPDVVVARLTALGYADIERPEAAMPDTVDLDDVLLANAGGARRDYLRSISWIEAGKPVPLWYVLTAAGRTDRGPADIARRLTALGYEAGAGHAPLPESPNPRDVLLVRAEGGGSGKWLDWGGEAPARQVLTVAGDLTCSPHVAAKRLIELGIRLPYTPEPEDDRILTYRDGDGRRWFGQYASVPVGHVLAVARELGRRPEDIVARLRELGCTERRASLPDSFEADDLLILSEELDGHWPWLVNSGVVGLQVRHILRAALATGRSPADIAERLAALGHCPHENAKLPEVADVEDIRLLETVDRSYVDNVHLENVLRSASLTGRSPADVASRLIALGYRLPDDVTYPEVRGAPHGEGALPATS